MKNFINPNLPSGENNLNKQILNLIKIEANNGRPIQAIKLFSEFLSLLVNVNPNSLDTISASS